MAINLPASIANDFQLAVRDGTAETVAITQDGVTTTVAGASVSGVSRKQLQMLGDIGIEQQLKSFSLPVANLDGVIPRNGSKITDSGGTAWTIIMADLATLDTRWRCVAQRQK